MFDNRAVHEFATKYLHLYENEDTLEYQVSERFSDQCFELGFEMDCGNAIEKTYPNMKILDDVGSLRRVINHISDIGLLASAIFSKYRYITHWSYCEELLSENNRTWFILAFERLAELSVEERFLEFSDDDMRQAHIPCIEGILERIHLRTNGLCYGPCPEPEDEVEQHLTIRRDGRVWFYGFNYGEDGVKTVKGRRIQYKMHQRSVNRIFEVFSKKFAQEYICSTRLILEVGI